MLVFWLQGRAPAWQQGAPKASWRPGHQSSVAGQPSDSRSTGERRGASP